MKNKNRDADQSASTLETKESPLTRKVKYASFNQRMLAAIFDVVIIMSLGYPLCRWVEAQFYAPVNFNYVLALYQNPLPRDEFYAGLWKIVEDQRIISRTILTNSLQIALLALYIIPCWIRYNTTPGKMIVGIEIRDADTYEFMSPRQRIKRFLGYIVSGFPFTLGFLWMLFNRKRKQCWHDKIANTVVLVKERRIFSMALRSKSQ